MTGPFAAVWQRRWWLLAVALVAAAAAGSLSARRTPTYQATALVQVVSGRQTAGQYVAPEELVRLTNVYAQIARTRPVLEQVEARPGVPEGARRRLEVTVPQHLEVLELQATHRSPAVAARYANAYAAAIVDHVETLERERLDEDLDRIRERIEELQTGGEVDPADQAELVALQERAAERLVATGDSVRVIEPAVAPSAPASPKPVRDAVLAGLAALLAGVAVLYARSQFNDRFSNVEEAQVSLGLPVLAEVPRRARGGPLVEAFRALRTSVEFSLRDHPHPVLLVTSAHSGAGKTFVTANLGRSLAVDGHRVVAVDADLRHPALHGALDVPPSPGLGELLGAEVGEATELYASEAGLGGFEGRRRGTLDVVAAGRHVADATEALASPRMERAVERLRTGYDIVLVDAPPVLPVVDPVVLARYADAVVMVVNARRDTRAEVRRAVDMLRAVDAPLVGFVFNGSSRPRERYGRYGGSKTPRSVPLAS